MHQSKLRTHNAVVLHRRNSVEQKNGLTLRFCGPAQPPLIYDCYKNDPTGLGSAGFAAASLFGETSATPASQLEGKRIAHNDHSMRTVRSLARWPANRI